MVILLKEKHKKEILQYQFENVKIFLKEVEKLKISFC